MSWNRDEIVDLLTEAGEIAKSAKRNIQREVKPDQSIVTQADRQIESVLSKRLERPDEGVYFIGEETIGEKGEDYVQNALRSEAFVVDPIDGTVPYSYGMPNWGISIGHMVNSRLTDGAVYLGTLVYVDYV